MTLKQQLVEAVMKRVYSLLNEGRNAEKAQQRTLEVIRKFFKGKKLFNDDELLDNWLGQVFNDPANTRKLSRIDYIENRLKNLCFHANIPDSVIRLEPIIMNIALSLGFEQQNQDTAKLNRLFRIMNYILKCVTEGLELPIQLNKLTLENTTYDRLNDLFGKVLDKQDADEEERINNADYSEGVNTAYEILSDIDYDTANYYGNYSCSSSKLCYTQDESTWNQYTNGGSNTVYLLLRKDWRKIPEKHRANTPYDDYGLSMIFVFIDEDGNIAYSNTRWNHRTNGQVPSNVDQSFTKEMLSKLLNVNFSSVFKPLHSFTDKVAEVKQQLQKGADPKKVFDYVNRFQEGFAVVRLGKKYNFIGTNNKILCEDLWFDRIWPFHNGFAMVGLGNKTNIIDIDGEFHSFTEMVANAKQQLQNGADPKKVFDYVENFQEGFAVVRLWGKWNLIDYNNNFLREDLWFDWVEGFDNGFARSGLGNELYYINTDGKLYTLAERVANAKQQLQNGVDPEDVFDDVWNFHEGFAQVKLGGKWNFIDTNNKILSEDLWFDDVEGFRNGFAVIYVSGRGYNFIDTNNKILREDLWFDDVSSFHNGFAKVQIDEELYFIDRYGNLYDNHKNMVKKVNENRRRVVRLTESQLRNTIKSVITLYLNEGRRR